MFLSVLNGDDSAKEIRELLQDLGRNSVKIYTSIVTVQEVSVDCYRDGKIATDNHGKVRKIARIEGITRDVALTAAKIEAKILSSYKGPKQKTLDNKRRKWDCFHIATAQCLKCSHLYSADDGMLKRKKLLGINDMEFSLPKASSIALPLFAQAESDDKAPESKKPSPLDTETPSSAKPAGDAS